LIVESHNGPRPPSKASQRWARRLAKQKALQNDRRAENQLIDDGINEVRAIEEAILDS
jgi:hypothetical protein